MDEATTHIDVRAVGADDALALHQLDYSFETDRIYTLRVLGPLAQCDVGMNRVGIPALAFELLETPADPPLYKVHREFERTLEDVEARLHNVDGGYVAMADG